MVGQPVKYRAVFPLEARIFLGAGAVALALGLWGGLAPAQRLSSERHDRPSLLLGGGFEVFRPPVLLDSVLPRGELRSPLPSRLAKNRLCSLKYPLCATSPLPGEPASLKLALSSLSRAYEELVYGAGLPRPGFSRRMPLTWMVSPREALSLSVSKVDSRGFDRGRASCRGGRATLEFARRCVSAAAIVARAPATASWLRDGYAAETSLQMGLAPESRAALHSSLRYPHVGVLTSSPSFYSWRRAEDVVVSRLRSLRFFSYLESRSRDRLGAASWLALTLGATRTKAGASRLHAEPDIFDVLFSTLAKDRNRLARLFDDFARASFNEFKDIQGGASLAWTLEGDSLPRSVVLSNPLEPTGSAYVLVKLTSAQKKKSLAFRVDCETPISYVWSVARLDEEGEIASWVPITYRHRGGQASASISPEGDTAALLLTGTNMGGIALSHPFDPDHEPHEGHGCRVAVNVLDELGARKD